MFFVIAINIRVPYIKNMNSTATQANRGNKMSKATKIKFGANESTSRHHDDERAILAMIGGDWVRVGTLEARTEMYYQNDGTQRKLVDTYYASLDGLMSCYAEVRTGSRYTGGTVVQSASSAKAEIKTKILETLNK